MQVLNVTAGSIVVLFLVLEHSTAAVAAIIACSDSPRHHHAQRPIAFAAGVVTVVTAGSVACC